MNPRLGLVLVLLLARPAFGCDQAGAFGFPFGKPVPEDATDVKDFWFQGGTAPGNVIRSFTAKVPAPLAGFDNYVYWSNRDRKIVHAITAFRRLSAAPGEASRRSALEQTRMEMEALRKSWSAKYGFTYAETATGGQTWEATMPVVSSTIGRFGTDYLYIECVHRDLQREALDVALGRRSR